MAIQESWSTSTLVLWHVMIIAVVIGIVNSGNGSSFSCIESERAALLAFKSSIIDPKNQLSSWEGEDCCSWLGVICSNITDHVLELNLHNRNDYSWSLYGAINYSLIALTRLRHLDLSDNNFNFSQIPNFLTSFKSLRYLNLQNSRFGGRVPPQLSNLSSLRYLNICYNDNLYSTTLDWLYPLSSLEFLDMTKVALDRAGGNWLHIVSRLSSLKVLRLRYCGLHSIDSSISHANFSNLVEVDLGHNELNSTVPQWLWNTTKLTDLLLDYNLFYGAMPGVVENMTFLSSLSLERNKFEGHVSGAIFTKLCNLNNLRLDYNKFSGDVNEIMQGLRCSWSVLRRLGLGGNMFRGNLLGWVEHLTILELLSLYSNLMSGPIPEDISKLSNLHYLFLNGNSFNGVITEVHFANLSRLKVLDMSYNLLSIDLKEDWVPPFQLKIINLSKCRLGPRFPTWLRWQRNISMLSIAIAGISDTMPEWFVNTSSSIKFLDLSNNQMRGKLPQSLSFKSGAIVNLEDNQFEGQIPPYLLYNASLLSIGYNLFKGQLPSNNELPYLNFLFLPNNFISSAIPLSLCKATSLSLIDLSNNQFFGEIPSCLPKSLVLINLANNLLNGRIPDSIYPLTRLEVLDLSGNNLSGKLPKSLQKCKNLGVLSLGKNNIDGNIPAWLGMELPNLWILQLRSNRLSGSIPEKLLLLSKLQILDLANNSLSGSIPKNFMNLRTLTSEAGPSSFAIQFMLPFSGHFTYFPLVLTTKAQQLTYIKNVIHFKSIDLSSNNLSGEILDQVCVLKGLINLNLSDNHLTGNIPYEIGDLLLLESLDLSMNQLSGEIPPSLASLTFLSYLNLSYNHLSGRIRSGNQLQTLNTDTSIYIGNCELLGIPLVETCSSDADTTDLNQAMGDLMDDEVRWFYLGLVTGFVVGLCGIFAQLLFNYDYMITCLFPIT